MGVITYQHGEVVELALDWPDKRNAMGPSEGRELLSALKAATTSTSVGAIILSGRGKAFCGGGDLREIVRLASQGPAAVKDSVYGIFQGIFRTLHESPVPVISAVEGAAIGLGCDLALATHVTFIGAAGYLAQGWIKAGLIPATGGTLYAARRGGPQTVWRLLSADKVDGPTAESWGLAIATQDARDSALAVATKLASLPRAPLRAVTRLAQLDDFDAHLTQALDFQIGFITDPNFPRQVDALLKR